MVGEVVVDRDPPDPAAHLEPSLHPPEGGQGRATGVGGNAGGVGRGEGGEGVAHVVLAGQAQGELPSSRAADLQAEAP